MACASDSALTEHTHGYAEVSHSMPSSHALMSAAMLDAKRARMKAENHRDALANRIARLQAEEVRASKRIEVTVSAKRSFRYEATYCADRYHFALANLSISVRAT